MLDAICSYTVTDLLTAYETEYLPSKAATTRYQLGHMFAWLRRELGPMLLTDLTPAFLRTWRDDLTGRGYAPGTVRRYLDCLSGPLSIAVRDYEWLPSNPLRKVQKPPETPARVRFLSDDERKALLLNCAISRNPHLYTFVLLALSTGARKNQLLQLRWRDVDVARGMLRLQPFKQAPRRSLPLRGPVLTLLTKLGVDKTPEAWVFARHDGRKPTLLDAAFQVACARSGITDMRIHDLRHTTASYLAMNGATLREIAEVLGHKTLAQTMKYSHLSEGHTGDILGKMVERFLAGALLAATLTTLGSVWLVWG